MEIKLGRVLKRKKGRKRKSHPHQRKKSLDYVLPRHPPERSSGPRSCLLRQGPGETLQPTGQRKASKAEVHPYKDKDCTPAQLRGRRTEMGHLLVRQGEKKTGIQNSNRAKGGGVKTDWRQTRAHPGCPLSRGSKSPQQKVAPGISVTPHWKSGKRLPPRPAKRQTFPPHDHHSEEGRQHRLRTCSKDDARPDASAGKTKRTLSTTNLQPNEAAPAGKFPSQSTRWQENGNRQRPTLYRAGLSRVMNPPSRKWYPKTNRKIKGKPVT